MLGTNLGLFVPNILDLPSIYPHGQRTAVHHQPALTRRQQVRGGRYMALAPARAGGEQQYGCVAEAAMARPSACPSMTQAGPRQAWPVILTPSTSTDSSDTLTHSPAPSTPCPMRSVDTSRLDDPFVGSTIRDSGWLIDQAAKQVIKGSM
jgi:hypothetical protein